MGCDYVNITLEQIFEYLKNSEGKININIELQLGKKNTEPKIDTKEDKKIDIDALNNIFNYSEEVALDSISKNRG